jgi:hypothetical protein
VHKAAAPGGPKRRRLQEASSLLHQVARKEVRDPATLLTVVFDWC